MCASERASGRAGGCKVARAGLTLPKSVLIKATTSETNDDDDDDENSEEMTLLLFGAAAFGAVVVVVVVVALARERQQLEGGVTANERLLIVCSRSLTTAKSTRHSIHTAFASTAAAFASVLVRAFASLHLGDAASRNFIFFSFCVFFVFVVIVKRKLANARRRFAPKTCARANAHSSTLRFAHQTHLVTIAAALAAALAAAIVAFVVALVVALVASVCLINEESARAVCLMKLTQLAKRLFSLFVRSFA